MEGALQNATETGASLHRRYQAAATALRLNAQTEQYNRFTNEVSRGGI